mgnify:CR=1 FL=1
MYIMMAINDRPAAHKQMRSLTARVFQAFTNRTTNRFGGNKPAASLTYTLLVSAPTDAISPAMAKPAVATCMLFPSMWRICFSLVSLRSALSSACPISLAISLTVSSLPARIDHILAFVAIGGTAPSNLGLQYLIPWERSRIIAVDCNGCAIGRRATMFSKLRSRALLGTSCLISSRA